MNGDSQQILNAVIDNGNRLTALETQKENQHQENIRNYEKLHKTISNVVKLKTHVGIQWWFIGVIIAGLFGVIWRVV